MRQALKKPEGTSCYSYSKMVCLQLSFELRLVYRGEHIFRQYASGRLYRNERIRAHADQALSAATAKSVDDVDHRPQRGQPALTDFTVFVRMLDTST